MAGRRILAGLALLGLTAGLASAAPEKQGGIFRIGMPGASTQVDPQLAYVTPAWWLEYATAAKLYNYPDKAGQSGGLLRPEVASGFDVSGDGRTYSFTIRKGFRFSDGTPVTAKNFAYAIKRAKDSDLASPAAALITEIASARAQGNKLVIRLSRSDPSLLTKLAMPFFQATSTKLPLKTEVTTGYPSAGPYYFATNEVNTLTSLRKNRYWGGRRPQHLEGVDVHWNQTANAEAFDLTTPPAADVPKLIERFGINKTRFWRMPVNCMSFIPLNSSNGIFAGNPRLRKAVNWALDRTEYFGGTYTITPWTHLLTPLTPGAVTALKKQPYGSRANIAKARKLAAGHFRDGRITVAYRAPGTVKLPQAQVVRNALIQLGFDPAKIVMKAVKGAEFYDVTGADMTVSMGWCSDAQNDGSSALHSVLGLAHFKGYDAKIAAAERLSPNLRAKAFGKLDIELMKNVAPLAPMGYYNNLFLFSNRVDPHSLAYNRIYTNFSIPALAFK